MKKKMLLYIGFFMTVMIAASSSADDSTLLAKAGDIRITSADLNRVIGYYTPEQREAFKTNPENKVRLLKKIMQERVLAADAKRLGIDKDPGVKEQIEIMINNQLTSELLKKEVAEKISVSDEEAGIYYRLHADEYKMPETVRVRHILVAVGKDAGEDTRKAARDKALSILKRIRAGEDFGKLAEDLSDDNGSKARGGDLGFFPRGKMIKPFEEAAFLLKAGEVSDIVETKYGYHIIKCEEKKTAGVIPFENAKDGIIEKIAKETTSNRIKEYVEKRMAEEKVEFFPERLLK